MEIPMHKFLNKCGFATIAMTLCLTPAMVAAQEADATETPPEAGAPAAGLTAEQEAEMQSWPTETQVYYQSLSPERQALFWALSDSDKVTLSNMPEPQRESTWAQIESRTAPSEG
jgi:hypothetical protein